MIKDNDYIDIAYTVMGMHYFEDGSKNQIKAMLHFAELYHQREIEKLNISDVSKRFNSVDEAILYLSKNNIPTMTGAEMIKKMSDVQMIKFAEFLYYM